MRHIVLLATAAALAAGGLGTGPAGAHQTSSAPGGRSAVAPAKPSAPATAVGLGETGVGACNPPTGPAAAVIDTQAPGRATYVAPFSGVLTAFSHQANGQAGQVQLLVFADGATPTQKTVVAKSDKLTVATNKLNTFAVRVPVKAGQRLGLGWSTTAMACAVAADYPGDVTLVKGGFDADTSASFVADGVLANGTHTFRPNIYAVLEPDRDRDGYGDLSQDGCPASAKLQVVCPDTKITKRPHTRKTRRRTKVKVRFSSTLSGSTFECRLDGHRKWRACSSPYRKKLGIGRHQLVVRAVGPNGVPDPRPAKVRFTIRRS